MNPIIELVKSVIDLIGKVVDLAGGGRIHKLQVAAKKSRDQKSKLEALIAECYKIESWLSKIEEFCLHGGKNPKKQSPIAKIKSIVRSSFPALNDVEFGLSLATSNYRRRLYLLGHLRETEQNPLKSSIRTEDLYEDVLCWREDFVTVAHELIVKCDAEKPSTDGKIRRFLNKSRRN